MDFSIWYCIGVDIPLGLPSETRVSVPLQGCGPRVESRRLGPRLLTGRAVELDTRGFAE